MVSHRLGILLWVFWLSVVRADDRGVYYDTTPRSWHESSANCQQLGAWEDTNLLRTARFRVPARPSGFRQDQFFWIGGSVHQTPWFKLLGCFETYDATAQKEFDCSAFREPKRTYSCMNFCDGFDGITEIGISKTTCYCYKDVQKFRKKKEQCFYETLPEYPGELFGAPNAESVVVYQHIKNSPSTYAPDFGNCAAVRYLGSLPIQHQFSSCLNRIGYMCANGRVSTAEVTWTEAVRQCGTLKTDVVGYYTGLTDSVKYRAFWTGFYRQSREIWRSPGAKMSPKIFRNWVSSNPEHIHCVAVKVKEDGTLYPNTYPQDCSKKLPSLCEKSTKVDGGWTEWSQWSKCGNVIDGYGGRKQTRTCTNPIPKHGGKDCEGKTSKKEICTPPSVDGGWTEWSQWSKCHAIKDGQGTRKKSRSCTNPSPQHGGKDCKGMDYEKEECTPPVDGEWTDWSQWTKCEVFNGKPRREKRRTCTNPSSQHGGKECQGPIITVEWHCTLHSG
ncbi:uncharacterized protein LOC134252857 [Saccostrea cucullata]|uniref:uncharacterized protein LOC134252857 n=1 Tax=Saccostrea cuccullata TaxID=36930 RepID=UPI002ED0D3ED